MRKWVLKAVVQKLFTVLPFGFKLNYFFQRYITKKVLLSDDFFETILSHYREMDEYTQRENFNFSGRKFLELGTGWHPIMPVALWLSGAEEVVTADLRSHLRIKNIVILLRKFKQYYDEGQLDKYIENINADRMQRLTELIQLADNTIEVGEVLDKMNIVQWAQDVTTLDYAEGYFDMCFSVNVYEHIHTKYLKGISAKLYNLNKEGGMAYHAIGVYDHFAHIDPTLSRFNYLRFSEKEWQWIDNDIQPQNRLRISFFRALFQNLGYKIVDEIMQDAEPEDLKKIKVHPDFQNIEDVDIPYGTFILRR